MSHQLRPQRLVAMLAVVGIAAGGALALPSVAMADGETWRSGGCSEGEGQTIVIDWIDPQDPSQRSRNIVRCIFLEEDATEYPVDPDNKLGAPLASAGFTFDPPTGVITQIEGISAPDQYWFYVIGEDGNWTTEWLPQPDIDSFLGVSLTVSKSKRNPVPQPKFDMLDPADEPTLEPPGEEPPKEEPPKEEPPKEEPPKEEPPNEEPPKEEPPNEEPPEVVPPKVNPPASPPSNPPTATPTNTATATSTQRPSRTQRPNQPPRRTTRPQRPTNRPQPPVNPPPFNPPAPPVQNFPELPPIDDPLLPPPEDGDGQATAAPDPTPSRIWGREDETRQGSEAIRSDTPAPWSQLAAVAGAVVIVGGLGTAFARGLQTSTPPVVEEE